MRTSFLICNTFIEFVLRESHFGFKTIKKMLEKEPNKRPNLREIIHSLSPLLEYLAMVNQKPNIEENKESLNQVKFHIIL